MEPYLHSHTGLKGLYTDKLTSCYLQTVFLPTYKTELPALLYPDEVTPQKWSKGNERKVKEKCK